MSVWKCECKGYWFSQPRKRRRKFHGIFIEVSIFFMNVLCAYLDCSICIQLVFLKYDLDLIILHYITWWHGYYLIVYHCSMFMLSTNCWGNAIFIFSLSFFYELLWNLGWLKSLPLCTFSSRNCYYHTDTNENC